MSEQAFDQLLGDLINEHARAAVRPIDRFAVAESAIAQGRRRTHPPDARVLRRWSLLMGLAAALLLPAAVFVTGQRADEEPALPTAWDALVVRPAVTPVGPDGVDLARVATDGTERHLGSLPGAAVPLPYSVDDDGSDSGYAFTGEAKVAPDGWLALEVRSWVPNPARGTIANHDRSLTRWWWALMDLTDPDPRVRLVEQEPGGDAAWGPSGRFATQCPSAAVGPCADVLVPSVSVQVVDARTGDTHVIEGVVFDRTAGLRWAADGSGLLTVMDRLDRGALLQARAADEIIIDARNLGIDHLDDRPRTLGVPTLAPATGIRSIGPGGDTLAHHGRGRLLEGTVPDAGRDLPDGTWLRQASFAADGRTFWLLLQEDLDVPRWVAVVHEDPSGPLSVLPDAASIAIPSAGSGYIAGLAPDDSMVVVDVVSDWTPRGAKVAVVPTAGGPVHIVAGRLAGFIPSDLPR